MSTAEDYVSLFDVGESKDDLDVSYRDYGGGDDTDEEDLQVKTSLGMSVHKREANFHTENSMKTEKIIIIIYKVTCCLI